MATPIWTGAAADLAGVWTITVANTWAASDTVTVSVGDRDVTVTTDTATVADIATQIANALNGVDKTDNLQATETRTAGGREYGEFWDLDDVSASGAIVTIIGKPGKAITIAVSESTAGSGTATLAATQTATGRHFWSNADNWSTGSVPANGDTVVFADSSVDCLYGFPNGSLQPAVVDVRASFTGRLGLPRTNRDVPQLPYPEYRQRRPIFDDDAASTTAHYIGRGSGPGSPLVNIEQSAGLASVTVTKTGTPQPPASNYAFNFVGASGDAATYDILDGSVSVAEGRDEAANASDFNVGQGPDANPSVYIGPGVTSSSSLEVLSGEVITNAYFGAYYCGGGVLTIDVESASTSTTASVYNGGTIRFADCGGLTNQLYATGGGTIDMRPMRDSMTVANATIYAGGIVLDPHGLRVTYTNGLIVANCNLPDVTLDLPQGITVSL